MSLASRAFVTVGFLLVSTIALAGQVHTLFPGQTLPLPNGNVVACMGGSSASQEPVIVSCTMVTKAGFFEGRATVTYGVPLAREEAKKEAIKACREHYDGRTNTVEGIKDICSPINNWSFIGFNCDQ